jgi:SAM-dependent methyltransferase
MDLRSLVGDNFFFPSEIYPHIHTGYRLVFMMATVRRMASRQAAGLKILEIGSWCGASMAVWAESLAKYASRTPGHEEEATQSSIVCVDPWGTYINESDLAKGGGYLQMASALKTGAARSCFIHNASVAEQKFGVSVMDFHGDSKRVLPMLQDSSFDIVYVDGSHYYDDVISDLREARRLCKNGGMICGDDLEIQFDQVDLDHAIKNIGEDMIEDPSSGKNYHPGVTVGLGQSYGLVSAFPGAYWCVDSLDGQLQKVDFSPADLGSIFIPSSLPPESAAKFFNLVSNHR